MKSLIIDTTSNYVIVSIVENEKILYLYNENCEKNLSEKFMNIVSEGFEKTRINPSEIDRIYAVTGPGSFTGIRIGLTFAKIMAWSKKIQIVPVSRLAVLASGNKENKYIVPIIDARRDYVYGAIYDNELNIIEKESHILLENLKEQTKKYDDIRYVSYDKFDSVDCEKPNIDILKIIKKHQNKVAVNPHEIYPNYLKNTEAEDKLMGKND